MIHSSLSLQTPYQITHNLYSLYRNIIAVAKEMGTEEKISSHTLYCTLYCTYILSCVFLQKYQILHSSTVLPSNPVLTEVFDLLLCQQ